MVHKRYVDIERMKEKYSDVFSVGENITVSVKIDGANASFSYDSENDKVVAFSRRNDLDENNTLRGFWNLTQQFPLDAVKSTTENGRYIIFGEWLISHTVKYPESMYNKFYMFDVYDTVNECYMPHDFTYKTYETLKALGCNIEFVPVLYFGKFDSWNNITKYVGVSHTGAAPVDEGVVIKSQDRLRDVENSRRPRYIKIVAEKFSEVHMSKPTVVDPEKMAKKEAELAAAQEIVTKRRIEKQLQKMIDNGELPENWDEKNMGFIAKNLCKLVYEDCVKEESDIVNSIENFGKSCSSLTMKFIREILSGKNKV